MKRCIVIYLLFFSFPMLQAQTYYVSPNATGSGNGSFNNEWTIYQAANNASAGDSVFVKIGQYNITSKLSFNNNGTASNPIVFVGEYIPGYDPKTVNGNGSSYFYCTYSNNGSVTINGDHIELHSIVMEHTLAKQIINVYGDYNTFDGCVIKYPPNSAGDHTVIIKPSAQNFTLRNSFIWNSGRTIIWVESNSSDAAHNALFEYNTFTGASNHYDIQIMPITTSSNPPNITGLIIRNNVFIDNPYEAAIYLRQVSDFKIYNNLFVNSGAPIHYVSHEVGQDSVNTNGSLIVYNTIYDVTHSKYWFRNAAANQLVIKNNLFVLDDGFGSGNTTMDYRCFASQPSNQRMQIDYNSYYFTGSNILNDGTAYWSNFCNNSSYSGMQAWKNATGFENNGIFNEQTTFKDPNNLDYTPVEGSVVNNAGTPIGGITTDFFGNQRNPNTPTIGAFEFTSGGGGGGNSPPGQPTNPSPPQGGTDQPINLNLSWSCTDPDGDPLTYDVYFGTSANPPLVSSNISNNNYNPGTLANGTTYFWKIVAKDNQGHSTTGNIWNFTTITGNNQSPNAPGNPDPPNNSTNQLVDVNLSWNCSDPDGDPLTYDVYFGTTTVPPLKATNLSSTSYNPGTLTTNTTYYWKVVAKDNQGASTAGPVWNFMTITGDITPPEVTGVIISDSVTVTVQFSEPLNEESAENIQNYEISPSISISSAELSGTEVYLSTSAHSPGVYQVTVTNVKDLAGNVIVPPNNTANYEYTVNYTSESSVKLSVYIEGPYDGDNMATTLNALNFLPSSQPFDISPWNYYGTEQVNQIPVDVVDWILLEVRSNTSSSSVLARRAAFLRKDGLVVDLDGTEKVVFPGLSSDLYYVVIRHRNHIPIMSAVKIQFSENPELYDFRNSRNKAYGNDPMKELFTGKFGLYSADGNASGGIDNYDFRLIWRRQKGCFGYYSGDFNLDAGVNIKDKNELYRHNKGKNSAVPQ